jgi:plastocyanin
MHPGMGSSGRRLVALLAVAALGGAGGSALGAVAQATPRAKEPRAKAKHKVARVRAVKIDDGGGWVPTPSLGAERAPLAGGARAGDGGATTGPGGGPTTTATIPPTGTPAPAPTLPAVGVTVDDRGGYTARLSRPTVTAGSVVVQLINQGDDAHNLRIVAIDHAGGAVDIPLTAAGTHTTQTLTLTPGSYRLFCTLTTPVNHETAGMNATLSVAAPTP